jgi:hypothetical protein
MSGCRKRIRPRHAFLDVVCAKAREAPLVASRRSL